MPTRAIRRPSAAGGSAGNKDLIPAGGTEAQLSRLMQVLAFLLPESSNSELFSLASRLQNKLTGAEPAQLPEGDNDGARD